MDKLYRLSHSTRMFRDTQAHGELPYPIERILDEIIYVEFLGAVIHFCFPL